MTELTEHAVRVMLNEAQIKEGVDVGVARIMNAFTRAPRFAYKPGDIWRAHIMGALAEAALVAHTGWRWSKDPNTFRSKADVGDVEVRWSGKDVPHLKVRDDEHDTKMVLVSGDVHGGFVIHGWFESKDAPRDGYWMESPPPCWFVHHGRMRPIQELIEAEQQTSEPWELMS